MPLTTAQVMLASLLIEAIVGLAEKLRNIKTMSDEEINQAIKEAEIYSEDLKKRLNY